MKAAVLRQVRTPLQIEDVMINTPGPHEVLVRTAAAGASDLDDPLAAIPRPPLAPPRSDCLKRRSGSTPIVRCLSFFLRAACTQQRRSVPPES